MTSPRIISWNHGGIATPGGAVSPAPLGEQRKRGSESRATPLDFASVTVPAVKKGQKVYPESSDPRPVVQEKIDRDALSEAAKAQAEAIFQDLLGPPTSKKGNRWRWGKKGSFSATVAGPKAGAWTDFESGEKGDLFELWAIHALGMGSAKDDFPRVLRDLAERVGVRGEITEAQRERVRARQAQREAEAAREVEAAQARALGVTLALHEVAKPIEGTPAEAYLRSRGVGFTPPPSAAQFIPAGAATRAHVPYANLPCLIVWARDASGRPTGGQLIILTADGRRALGKDGTKLPKFSFGKLDGARVVIPATADTAPSAEALPPSLFICEGPETSFTIAEATGGETWACLGAGNFASLELPTDRALVFCPDQDAPDSPAALAFNRAIEAAADLNTWIARAPEPVGSKRDLNDTAQREGIEAVRAALADAEPIGMLAAQPMPWVGRVVDPEAEPATMTADEVGRAVRRVVDSFLSEATGGDQWLVKASLGSGKSRAMIEAVAQRVKDSPDNRVLIRVPNHKLAQETEAALAALGVSVGVWRGTDAADPSTGALALPMCRRADDLKEVRAAGGTHTALCGRRSKAIDDATDADADAEAQRDESCTLCPFYPVDENPAASWCGYRQQDLRDASVVIVAHDVSITRKLPVKVRRRKVRVEDASGKVTYQPDPRPDFNFVILDETSAADLLVGADGGRDVFAGLLYSDLDAMAEAAGVDPSSKTGGDDIDRQIARDKRVAAELTRYALADLFKGILKELPEPGSVKAAQRATEATGAPQRPTEGHQPPWEAQRLPAGRVSAMTFLRAGITLQAVRDLRKAIWNWAPSVSGADGLHHLGVESIAAQLAPQRRLFRTVSAISALCDAIIQGWEDAEATGDENQPFEQIRLRRSHGDDGPRLAINLMCRADITDTVLAAPVLILDATPQVALLRAWFPNLQVKGDFRAKDGEGVTRVQLIDTHMPYSALAPQAGHKDYRRQKHNSWRSAVITRLFAEATGGPASLIVPQRTEEYLTTAAPAVLEGITTGHFGAVRGSNAFEESRVLITAGRQAPRLRDAERAAAVIAGRPVQAIEEDDRGRAMFAQREAAILMRDGTGRGVLNESHPDPIVDAVRRGVTEDELDQAQGRGRAARRGVDRPLLDIRLSDVASDQPVDVIWTMAEFKALGGFAGLALGAGVWPVGRGRARLIQKALAAHLRALGVDLPDLPDRPLASFLAADDDATASDMLRMIVSRNDALGRLIRDIDRQLAEDGAIDNLAGVPVQMGGWHRLTAVTEGSYSCAVMVRGATEAEAVARAARLFGAEYTIQTEAEATEGAAKPSASDLAAQRLAEAVSSYGVILKSPRAAARYMPDIWPSHTLAEIDLAYQKDIGKRLAQIRTNPNIPSIGKCSNFEDSFANIFCDDLTGISGARYAFDVMFKPRPCEQWKRPRHTAAVIFANSKEEAREKAESLIRRLLGDDLGAGFAMSPLESFEVIDVAGLHDTLDLPERVALGAYDYARAAKRLIWQQRQLAQRVEKVLFKPPDRLKWLFMRPSATLSASQKAGDGGA